MLVKFVCQSPMAKSLVHYAFIIVENEIYFELLFQVKNGGT